MQDELSQNWWALALRGVVAIVFGVAAFLLPIAALLALVLLFGAYALIDGILSLIAGFRGVAGRRNWLIVLGGIAGIIVGVLTPLLPGMTALLLVLFIGWWAVITGAFALAGAFEARHRSQGAWWLAFDGILSIIAGAVMVLFPGIGAIALVWLIAAYAIVSGITLLVVAFRLRGAAPRETVSRSGGSRAAA